MKPVVFPTAYLPDIVYYAHYLAAINPVTDIHEHYEKQTCRNRAAIMTAGGKQTLTVPVSKKHPHTPVKDVKISYQENWPQVHWRTIKTAYSSAPFFEFYAFAIEPVFFKEHAFLIDLNTELFAVINEMAGLEIKVKLSEKYPEKNEVERDYRQYWHSTKDHPLIPAYPQVFDEKHGFLHNLSILDLLFNTGPETPVYLEQLAAKLRAYYSG
ncbi:MAG: WbqC family protein [Bacteroidota bacterium]